MPDSSPNYAEQIDRIMNGYREAQLLICANRLGVFVLLEERPRSAVDISSGVSGDERAVRILCDALVAMSLLEKKGDRYSNTDIVRACLLPSSPSHKAGMLVHNARLYERWGTLYRVIRNGRPVEDEELDPELRFDEKVFARAMADSGRAMARETASALDLGGARKLLDVGGGPGLYSIAFAQANPGLRAVILDNQKTLEVAGENIREAGLSDRVSGLPGDVFSGDIGGPYDFIFVSNVIHQYDESQNRELVRRCAAALESGGRLCIKDFLLEPGRTSPPSAALFAVNMLVNTEAGDCYTREEVKSWCQAAGLEFVEKRALTPQSGIVVARKP